MRLRQLWTIAVFIGLTGSLIAQTPDPRPLRATMWWANGHEVNITAASVQGEQPLRTYGKAKVTIDGVTIFADEVIVDRDEIRLQGNVHWRPK